MNATSGSIGRPIFVIGTGRSGTTLLFDLLARHSRLGWVCQYASRQPLSPRERVVAAMAATPVLRSFVPNRWPGRRPMPEPYPFWLHAFPGFAHPCRDLDARDAYPAGVRAMRTAVVDQLRRMGKTRFITKYTGWSRIRFVDAVFEDACYVHVVRDGRAVAASLLRQDFWQGWGGPDRWRWGPLSSEDAARWERSGRSFYVLAGLQWKLLMENITEQGAGIGNRYVEIRYETLIRSPAEALEELAARLDLGPDAGLAAAVRTTPFRDVPAPWRDTVPPSEIRMAEELLGPALTRFGYSPE